MALSSIRFNKLSRLALCLFVVSLLFAAGCRTSPVYNVNYSPVAHDAQKELSLEQVKNCILKAGVKRGWAMAPLSPGHIVGTLMVRSHKAVVDINYDTKSYSIKYKDSNNLDYDGQKIKNNYNGWVKYLDGDIQKQIAMKLAEQ